MSTVTQVSSARAKRKPMTPEQRQRDIERQRRFRREHPERCKEYRRRWFEKQVAKKISPVKDNAVTLLNNHQVEINREEQKTAIPVSVKKALCFVAVCVSLLVVLLVMDTRCDELIGEIATMENQIAIAKGENVRLNAELSSMVSTDKIESYAEDVLGMVKAENYQISYIDLSGTDEILVSGDKSVGDSGDFSGKIKELIAYIF